MLDEAPWLSQRVDDLTDEYDECILISIEEISVSAKESCHLCNELPTRVMYAERDLDVRLFLWHCLSKNDDVSESRTNDEVEKKRKKVLEKTFCQLEMNWLHGKVLILIIRSKGNEEMRVKKRRTGAFEILYYLRLRNLIIRTRGYLNFIFA